MTLTTPGFASRTIGLTVNAPTQPLAFDALVGVALRHNPKRAHLLVSRALGKHTPQRPDIIAAAARILATLAADAISGRPSDAGPDLLALNNALTIGGPAPTVTPAPTHETVRVIGFAEAASALGATVADALDAYYVCSTRTPAGDVYGEFTEEHSHASAHYLTPKDASALNDPDCPIILVDDELTTGRTAMNLIRTLHTEAAHPHYVIATLADLRDRTARARLEDFATEISARVDVVALFTGELTTALDAIERAAAAITESATPSSDNKPTVSTHLQKHTVVADTPTARDGIPAPAVIHAVARDIVRSLPTLPAGRTLVLGVEEDMTLPLQVACLLHTLRGDVDFSSTTRSPAAVINRPDYPVRDTVTFTGTDGSARFVYNLGGGGTPAYTNVVIVSSDPLYTENAERLAAALEGRVPHITSVTTRPLPSPLRGPQFGSYQAADVAWLLNDLSDVDLEVGLEERERRVQTGGHYAESLPVEFQPDTAYFELFETALARGRARVARDVATVGDRIMVARRGRPVLVSLARAGTPVGVLLRRWFQHAYRLEVPHYAVSIVRGRGIDSNALRYLTAHHDPTDLIFVDGWTGKGAIKAELDDALQQFALDTGISIPADLAVLADTAQVTDIYGTRDDYLIPSAALNSTVSGLISRTVLNDTLIGPDDYHGAKFYAELTSADMSETFIEQVAEMFPDQLQAITPTAPATWTAWKSVRRIADEYGIGSVNLVKPGVGETTRVLLRRVPWKVLLSPDAGDTVDHIRALAHARGVPVETIPGLPFNAVGLIHPIHTPGATGFDGKAAE